MLSTPSSKQRFDFSGRQELYTAYIPWAVAFGCADEWAKKYRTETGTEPPVPAYFAGATTPAPTPATTSTDGRRLRSHRRQLDLVVPGHAVLTSSGGGGGFSGGGGGGGGGGAPGDRH